MTDAVVPRFDLVNFSDYTRMDVQYTRGCPHNCEFCDIIVLFGRKLRYKTTEQILGELDTLRKLGYRGQVNFVDDNFIGNRERAKAVLKAMKEWSERNKHPFYFSSNTTTTLAKEEEILSLMRDNDFRYMFFGIESPDEDVLIQMHKRQNTIISVVDAVETVARYGIAVVGSFILGFDNETENTARNMATMIQETGIIMAYVGLLFALPNTQLTQRLKQEGRHFGEGWAMLDNSVVDQVTSGLNFVTLRPRVKILQDYVDVVRYAYDPENYYARVLRTAEILVPNYKHRPKFSQAVKLAKAFIRVSAIAGFSKKATRRLYWKAVFRVMVKNPRMLNVVVVMAAVYIHFARHKDYIIRQHEEAIIHINSIGEDQYNEMMLGTQAVRAW